MNDNASCFRFGAFTLVPSRRLLLHGTRRLAISSRAFDILAMLLERAGAIVSVQELLAQVWKGSLVDQGTLRVHIASLRRVLDVDGTGERFLENIPSQGYRITAPISSTAYEAAAESGVEEARPLEALGARHRLVGRDAAIATVFEKMRTRRCVTLTGAGGIGKTSVARALADMLQIEGQNVVVVELAPITDATLVASAMASALQTGVSVTNPVAGLSAFLKPRQLVLLIDNCEHLLGAVGPLVDALLRAAPRLKVLCTSREPLLVDGEWVHRLAPLPFPPSAPASVTDARQYPAVRLFVDRVRASGEGFELSDQNVLAVADICRRLDGIPLAIELAAAGAAQLGAHHLATLLKSRLALMQQGHRNSAPRHLTLQATLDWSYQLLGASEQEVFRRMALFRNAFTLDALRSLCPDQPALQELVAYLVAKSLVVADAVGDEIEYRLLELTRDYARSKLDENDGIDALRERHALYVLTTLTPDSGQADARQPPEWLTLHGRQMDDIRASVTWAIGERRAGLAMALVAAAAPLWFAASLMADYKLMAEAVLGLRHSDLIVEERDEMVVCEAYGHALWHTGGKSPDISQSFNRALEIAERLQAVPHQLRSIWGLWLVCNSTGDYGGSASLAVHFGAVADRAGASAARLTHTRMLALGLHYYGDQQQALLHARAVLAHPATVNHTARNSGFQFDQRVAALTVLARILWISGEQEEALSCATQAVEEALRIDHALSLCYALANGCVPVAFWSGEHDLAARWTALLLERANEHSLVFWQAFAHGYQHLVEQASGNSARRRKPSAAMADPGVSVLLLEIMCTIDAGLADEWVFERARAGAGGWCAAELQRIAAMQGLRSNTLDAEAAVALLEKAREVAQGQGARSWELRICADLAALTTATC